MVYDGFTMEMVLQPEKLMEQKDLDEDYGGFSEFNPRFYMNPHV